MLSGFLQALTNDINEIRSSRVNLLITIKTPLIMSLETFFQNAGIIVNSNNNKKRNQLNFFPYFCEHMRSVYLFGSIYKKSIV